MVYKGLKTLEQLFFPLTCVLCGESGDGGMDLCPGCRSDFPFIYKACKRCGIPLLDAREADDICCGRCLREPPWFDRAFIPLRYEPPVDWLIQQFKFNGRLSHMRVLAQLLSDCLEQAVTECPEVIIPVPLHENRLQQRGFNQAVEIARLLARNLKVPLNANLCARRKDTPQQSELSSHQRRANMRNAFYVTQKLNIKSVAIVDDVVTTGATANALAKLLKKNDVMQVQVWAVARTLPYANN